MDLYHKDEQDVPKAYQIMTNLSEQNFSFASYALMMNIVKNPKTDKLSYENYKNKMYSMCQDGVFDACERFALALYEENNVSDAKEIFSILADHSFHISKTMMCVIATQSQNQLLHDKYCIAPFNIEVLHHLTREFLKIENLKALKTLIQMKLPISDAKSLVRDKIYQDFGKYSLIQRDEYGNYLRKVQETIKMFSIKKFNGNFKLLIENYFNSLEKLSESSKLPFQKGKLYSWTPWKLPRDETKQTKVDYCDRMNRLATRRLEHFISYYYVLKACSDQLNHAHSQYNIGIQIIEGKYIRIGTISDGWKWIERASSNGHLQAAEWLVQNSSEIDERLPTYIKQRNKLKSKLRF